MIRVVIDTNVLVSAIILEYGLPRQIIQAWQQKRFTLLTSTLMIAEVVRVLHYPHLQKTYHLTEQDILLVQDVLLNDALVLEDTHQVTRSRDPQDDIFLASALEGQADYVVSGDLHPLEIKHYHGVQIVTPQQFITILQTATRSEQQLQNE